MPASAVGAPCLQLERVSRHFGGLKAVDDVTLSVQAGARHAVIGPNGAGKTTLFNVISGEVAPTAGTIVARGEGHLQAQAASAGGAWDLANVSDHEAVSRAHGDRERAAGVHGAGPEAVRDVSATVVAHRVHGASRAAPRSIRALEPGGRAGTAHLVRRTAPARRRPRTRGTAAAAAARRADGGTLGARARRDARADRTARSRRSRCC